ncbi:MAG: hypothetical protein ACYS8L_02160 [Planctomycetota bacterium]
MVSRAMALSVVWGVACVVSGCEVSGRPREAPFPEGREYFTLLSAAITPEVITTEGSDVVVCYRENMPLEEKEDMAVCVLIPAKGSTTRIVTRLYSRSSEQVEFRVSNPERRRGAAGYGAAWGSPKGELSGSGTIYVYLTRMGDTKLGERADKERLSNILSVQAFFGE